MGSINIEEIMEEIRGEIREKGYKVNDLSFNDIQMYSGTGVYVGKEFSFPQYKNELRSMESRWEVPLDPSYTSSNIAIQLIKKIIKKLCRFFTFPMTMLQNGFNGSVVRVNFYIYNYIKQNEKEKKKLEKRIEELEKMIAKLTEE